MTTSQIETLRDTINDALQVITNASKQINQAPDPYAELKAAHAAGKVIQSNIFGTWADIKRGNSFNDIAPCYLRIKPDEPWTLPRQLPGFRALRDGEEWHRMDFTREMLEPGERPLLCLEPWLAGDSIMRSNGWEIAGNSINDAIGIKIARDVNHCKTKRPLPILTPQQIAEGWIEWHGGENPVPGKRVSLMLQDGSYGCVNEPSENLIWEHLNEDHCGKGSNIIAYRVIDRVIEPKLVPLGPDDLRCGDEVKHKEYEPIYGISIIYPAGVSVPGNSLLYFEELKDHYLIRRRNSDTFEPCHKEVAHENN